MYAELITAADLMKQSPRTCSRFSRVIEAVLVFKDEVCGMVPVVEEGKPIGVVTDRDVALALAKFSNDLAERPVEEVMITPPITVPSTATRDEIVDAFRDSGVRRLMVIDDEGLLQGIITWKDLALAVSDREIGRVVADVLETPAPG